MARDYRVSEFDSNNFNLVSLASEATVDISNYLYNGKQEDKSVIYLSKILNEATQGDSHWQYKEVILSF